MKLSFFSEWLYYYYSNHLFFIFHIGFAIYIFIDFVRSMIDRHEEKLRKQPLMVDYYVQNITRRYHFYAELFLFTGLAGAAFALQSIFNTNQSDLTITLSDLNLESVRKALAISAGGILWAVACYILRAIILSRYQTALENGFETIANNESSHAQELKKLHTLLECFLNKQSDSIPFDKFDTLSTQIEALNNTLKSDIIQKNFTQEVGKLLINLNEQTKEHLDQVADSVRATTDLIQESRKNLDRQFENSRDFLIKLEDLQAGLNRISNGIATRLEQISIDIKGAHQPFLDSVKAIHINLTDTTNQITNDLKRAHETLREKFVDEVRKAVQIHKTYVDSNQKSIQTVADATNSAITQLIQKLGENFDGQLKQSQQFLDKLEYMQNSGKTIAARMEKISESAQDMQTSLTGTTTQMTNDLKKAHQMLREQFVKQVEKFIEAHQEYIKGNHSLIQSALDQVVGQLSSRLSKNLSEEHATQLQQLKLFLEHLLGQIATQTEKRLTSAEGVMQEYRNHLDKQLENSRKLEELQEGLNSSGNQTVEHMENVKIEIQETHQHCLEDMTNTSNQMTQVIEKANEIKVQLVSLEKHSIAKNQRDQSAIRNFLNWFGKR